MVDFPGEFSGADFVFKQYAPIDGVFFIETYLRLIFDIQCSEKNFNTADVPRSEKVYLAPNIFERSISIYLVPKRTILEWISGVFRKGAHFRF